MSAQHVVMLTEAERERLAQLVARRATSAHQRRRARVLLAVDRGPSGTACLTDREAGGLTHCSSRTVARVRMEFATTGLERTLTRQPRSDRKPTLLDGEAQQRLVAIAYSPAPPGAAGWTLQLLADRLVAEGIVPRIARETVRLTLKKTGVRRTGRTAASAFPPPSPGASRR